MFLTCGYQPKESRISSPRLRNIRSSIKLNISGSFKMKYSSVKRKLTKDNTVDVCGEPDKITAGLEFIEAEASLGDPGAVFQLERHFSFSNYLLVMSDEEMEVTAV